MHNVAFKFCPFQDDLIQHVLETEPCLDTVFIFPTARSQKVAIKAFLEKWDLSNSLFLTMEEFKERLFLSDRPVLKEEKRMLAFYGCLTGEDKQFFRINNYFQAVELAQQFFSLWEEFNEELVDEQIDYEKLASENAEMLDWQLQVYERLKKIKSQYELFIAEQGFDDFLFCCRLLHLQFALLQSYRNFVFVNQFYYTGLEKAIISLISREKNVTIWYQLPEQLVDKTTLEASDIKLRDLDTRQLKDIELVYCKTDFSMITHLIWRLEQGGIRTMVDAAYPQKPMESFLDVGRFTKNTSMKFNKSSLYRFFSVLLQLLDGVRWEGDKRRYLLPIQSVLHAVLENDFFKIFPGTSASRQSTQQATVDYLYDLIDKEIRYVDTNGHLFSLCKAHEAVPFLEKMLGLLDRCSRVGSIHQLVDLIDTPEGIDIRQIITAEEHAFTDIADVFYHALADFLSIESIGLVSEWRAFFAPQQEANRFRLAASIFRLFLEYVKSKTIKTNSQLPQTSRIEMTDLLDTRNLSFDELAVINLTEGLLPTARKTPFLFTERQRKALGLKTFDDIRNREKYYFFRLICGACKVHLFAVHDVEKNIEASSFVEEIRLFMPSEKLKISSVIDSYYSDVYRAFLHADLSYRPARETVRHTAFYTLPREREGDFNRSLRLGYYDLKELLNNPFIFYIRQMTKSERKADFGQDFSKKLIGNIAHDIIRATWELFEQQAAGLLFGYDFALVDERTAERAWAKILARDDFYYYRIPKDYSRTYFDLVTLKDLFTGIVHFFRFLHRLGLDGVKIRPLPEQEYATSVESGYKPFVSSPENKLATDVLIRGRADLRIELPEENRYYIFDYKTGSSEKEQLIIYEWFYYLAQQPELAGNVFSFFYYIFDRYGKGLSEFGRSKSGSTLEMAAKLKGDLVSVLDNIAERGFYLPDKKTALSVLADICRKDLYFQREKLY
jgi:ATP-dependent helicase/nuclease subunit B